jgi:hypothetical protein
VLFLLVLLRTGWQTCSQSQQLALALLLLMSSLLFSQLLLLLLDHLLVLCLQHVAVMLGPASMRLLQLWIQLWIQLWMQLHLHAQGRHLPKLPHRSADLTFGLMG